MGEYSDDLFGFLASEDWLPQLFMLVVYGYILFSASNLISDGSEMLLSVYGPGIIGGLVIPILGAVPDGAIIMASGVGGCLSGNATVVPGGSACPNVQEQVSVGVGTLAGSTIMLLTIPWGVGIYMGRRDLDPNTGEAAFDVVNGKQKARLTHFSMSGNVITTTGNVPAFAKIMMVSSISYLIVQIPAFFDSKYGQKAQQTKEAPFALAGFIITFIAFIGYSYYQLVDAKHEDLVRAEAREAQRVRWKADLRMKLQSLGSFEKVFDEYDKDKNGTLDRIELSGAMRKLGFDCERAELNQIFREMDADESGSIDRSEFHTVITKWMAHAPNKGTAGSSTGNADSYGSVDDEKTAGGARKRMSVQDSTPQGDEGPHQELLAASGQAAADDDDDEEEEEEEEFIELSDAELKLRAFLLLGMGTALVTLFSDPMVGVINAFGKTIKVPAFYVSFILTPIASNASEVISAMVFAKKKTTQSISLTLSSLYGAACMNNTFSLAIFMALVKFRKLTWDFSAEVITIIVVILAVGANGLKTTINLWQALFVASLYPLSLCLVAVLENGFGLK